MSSHRARITEVFPMRLGGETLVDLTLETESADGLAIPAPDERVFLLMGEGGGERELTVWAAPNIVGTRDQGRFNLQFRREDLAGVMPEVGMVIRIEG